MVFAALLIFSGYSYLLPNLASPYQRKVCRQIQSLVSLSGSWMYFSSTCHPQEQGAQYQPPLVVADSMEENELGSVCWDSLPFLWSVSVSKEVGG